MPVCISVCLWLYVSYRLFNHALNTLVQEVGFACERDSVRNVPLNELELLV